MLRLLTNVPTTHTRDLLAALGRVDVELEVAYRTTAAATGRAWEARADDPRSVRRRRAELVAALGCAAGRHRGDDVVLTGGWASPVEVLRRCSAPIGARSALWWGERLRPTTRVRAAARAGWLRAPGLSAVLAVGSAAVDGYREATADRLAVHVLPYVTDRGLDAEPAPADEPVLGVVARLLPYKGVDVAIAALAHLPDGVRLEVVGDGPEAAPLAALARRRGGDVALLGPLDPEALDERRRRWWAQVVPNRSVEGWGMGVNEALNSGVPVVATAHVTAAIDLVRPGVDGAIVPATHATDPEALADAIRPLLDRDVQRSTGTAARRVGRATSATAAAPWLVSLLADRPGTPRSFPDDAWAALDRASTERR